MDITKAPIVLTILYGFYLASIIGIEVFVSGERV